MTTTPFTESFLLIWNLAALEAQAGTHDAIRPEHFFIALCKADEIPVGALREDGSPAMQEQLPQIESELRAVRALLDQVHFDRKSARRQVRAALGQPGKAPSDGIWHRTGDAHWLCDRARRLAIEAGEKQAEPLHLLKAFLDPEANFPVLEQVITLALREAMR